MNFALSKAAWALLRPFSRRPFQKALEAMDFERAGKLLALGVDPDAAVPGHTWTPLGFCALMKSPQSVAFAKALLDRGADPNLLHAKERPLHGAARAAFPELLTLLLERGADPALPNDKGQLPEEVLGVERHPVLDGPRRIGPAFEERRRQHQTALEGMRAQLQAARIRNACAEPPATARAAARL